MVGDTYGLPPAVLYGIYETKRGEIGGEYGPQANGTYELGLMKINSSRVPELANEWEVSGSTAWEWVRDDACTNIGVTGWLLRENLMNSWNLADAIALYNEGTEEQNAEYKEEVIAKMEQHHLLKQ
ncbi:lytic transglycosylase domain-containing protein [Amaricoccus solimangrovi]|uniref:Lytic transglycosylase domain-containing protein n=2 Tax=Amaricoccus solimangrovi TaxID=2589815 RepID=A0A501WAS0_9RHOB|nr:lytic transglycosylase domain-containing protein [Amaricoccus solimangrovi]